MPTFTHNTEHPITIPCDDKQLSALLHIPSNPIGIILFAHGSGSSRLSKRNQFVANILQQAKFATLLFDLLTPEEEQIDNSTAKYRFDIELLSKRLAAATHWLTHNPVLNTLPIGYFGASTGGAAAIVAAARLAMLIKAVVSRGGRVDLAGESLHDIKAPTLLIVGGEDDVVVTLNQQALGQLHCEKKLEIIPGATHLFEEPGTLAKVAQLAAEWFANYLL